MVMGEPEAAQAARGSVLVPESVFADVPENADWRYVLQTTHGLDPKVMRECYTPVEGCRGVEHLRTQFQRENKIPPIPFDPKCVGKPLLWNNSDNYTIARVWCKKTQASFAVEKATPPMPNMREGLEHLRQMLLFRPLSTDLDRWAKLWAAACREEKRKADMPIPPDGVWLEEPRRKRRSDSEEKEIPAFLPPVCDGTPRSAADLLDWENAEIGTLDGYKIVRIPYIPGRKKCDDESENMSSEWTL